MSAAESSMARRAAGTDLTHAQILEAMSAIMLAMLMAALDQTIVATALPTIAGDLGNLDQLSWVVTAYLLTSTVSMPLYGKLSDLYGRKVLFQLSMIIFVLGSAISGAAWNMTSLIFARAFQGLGGGGLMILAQSIIGDIVSPRQRGRYQGYIGSVFAFASVVGPLLGGFFVDNLTWRWIFYINVPLSVIALIVAQRVLHLPKGRPGAPVDWAGSATLMAGLTSILLVTVWGGNQYAWTSWEILGLAALAVVSFVAFVLVERRAKDPILPLRLFRDRTFATTTALGFVLGFAMLGAIVYLPLFLQVVLGASATNSGLLLIPMMGGVVLASIGSGQIITRIGRYKWAPLVGTLMMSAGLYLFSTMDPSTTTLQSSAYMVLMGLGMGMVLPTLILIVQNAVHPRDLGVGTSTVNVMRGMGGVIGVTVLGTVFNRTLQDRLASDLKGVPMPPGGGGFDPSVLLSSPTAIHQLPGPIATAVIDAVSYSSTHLYLLTVPLTLLGFLLAVAMPELELRESSAVALMEGGGDVPRPPATGSASAQQSAYVAPPAAPQTYAAEGLTDGILVVRNGEVVASGTPQELKLRSGEVLTVHLVDAARDLRRARKATADLLGPADRWGDLPDGFYVASPRARDLEADLVAALTAARVQVANHHVRTPSLDEAYLKLTGNGKNGAGAE